MIERIFDTYVNVYHDTTIYSMKYGQSRIIMFDSSIEIYFSKKYCEYGNSVTIEWCFDNINLCMLNFVNHYKINDFMKHKYPSLYYYLMDVDNDCKHNESNIYNELSKLFFHMRYITRRNPLCFSIKINPDSVNLKMGQHITLEYDNYVIVVLNGLLHVDCSKVIDISRPIMRKMKSNVYTVNLLVNTIEWYKKYIDPMGYYKPFNGQSMIKRAN